MSSRVLVGEVEVTRIGRDSPYIRSEAVTVWDQGQDQCDSMGEVLCWQSYAQKELVSSLPRYVDVHAERLRAKYLAFIHDLGESRIDGKRIVDHLDMGDGFSFWWMTRLAEKSPYRSPRIYDCLRLLALEEILLDRKPPSLTFHSSDRDLAQAIQRLCQHLHITFEWRASRQLPTWSFRRLYHGLPHWLQGLTSLRHLVPQWPLRKLNKSQWFSGEGAIFICSYFTHLDRDSCAEGHFYSRLWERFPKYLHDSGRQTNWIQHFLLSSEVPDARTGLRLLKQFNRDASRQGCHAFLSTYLTWRVVGRILKIWFRLISLAWRLRNIQSVFYPHGSSAWLWPILRKDWRTSLGGSVALHNCLSLLLFDVALRDIPTQRIGLYLCENLSWEKALLRAWRKHGHGHIIAVPHTTVPFWALNHFDDPRSLDGTQLCAMPLPDRVGVNGPMAREAYRLAGYPVDKLVEVEALRYFDLLHMPSGSASNTAKHNGAKTSVTDPRDITILILGDCLPTAMHNFLCLLEQTVKTLPSFYKFTFRQHPRHQVRLAEYPGLHARVTMDQFDRVRGEYDCAIAISSTNAAVEAYVKGLPVIISLDETMPNVSPLRGMSDVSFVSTTDEMINALRAVAQRKGAPRDHGEFFFLDQRLSRWERLLSKSLN